MPLRMFSDLPHQANTLKTSRRKHCVDSMRIWIIEVIESHNRAFQLPLVRNLQHTDELMSPWFSDAAVNQWALLF